MEIATLGADEGGRWNILTRAADELRRDGLEKVGWGNS